MSLEESLVKHCAPTLAGIKVASLYCFFPDSNRQFALQMKRWREWFAHRGLCLTVLRRNRERNSYQESHGDVRRYGGGRTAQYRPL